LNGFHDRYGGSVVFVAFDSGQEVGSMSNDAVSFSKLAESLRPSMPRAAFPEYVFPADASAVMAECDLALCMRLHPAALAVKNAIPFVSLAYDQKVANILAYCGLAGHVADIENIHHEDILERLDNMWRDKGGIREKLQTAGTRMSELAYGNVAQMRILLESPYASPQEKHSRPLVEFFYAYLRRNISCIERKDIMREIRELVNGGEHRQALALIQRYKNAWPEDEAELPYLLGVCLLQGGQPAAEIVAAFEAAAQNGFSEFWVRYHLGQLYCREKNYELAREHLAVAKGLDASHEGVLQLWQDCHRYDF
jgi:tetratricopeptide (TPR) repeat protein